MTSTTAIDPVAGLVSYVEEIKPYHSKIIEVLVEYIHTDCIDVTITEDFELALGVPADYAAWGWSEEEANRMFNDNWTNYQISGGGFQWWDIYGDYAGDFPDGTKFLVKSDNGFQEFTSWIPIKFTTTVNGQSIVVTRLITYEAVTTTTTNGGAIFHSSAYAFDENTQTYSLKAGLVFPSAIGVAKTGDCGGFGTQFEHILAAGALVPNSILGYDSASNYFDISNVLSPPISGANTWADILRYGVKLNISGTTVDGEYTVFLSTPLGDSPETLRVYVLENLAFSGSAGGTLTVREWGYDEPDVCATQGQSLEAAAHIHERLEFTINDVGYNGLAGWDLDHWDLNGFDGGPVIVVATLN